MNLSHLIFLFTLILPRIIKSLEIKNNYHEKDMSELCKRRVIPSIFLGRHVLEASALILYFAKLDLPYNCFISVRSESGSNMVMVVDLPLEPEIKESCDQNAPPFTVYEMGETFGGYWGPIPEDLFKHESTPIKFYTLKSTEPTTTKRKILRTTTTTTTSTANISTKNAPTENTIVVEIPLVEVSGILEPGDGKTDKSFDYEAAFDYQFDVTPIAGEKYDTSIMPLVELLVKKQPGSRKEGEDKEDRYDIDIMEDFTPDIRLTQPPVTPVIKNKYKPNVNRRLHFGKIHTSKNKFLPIKTSSKTTTIRRSVFTKYEFPTTRSTLNHKLNNPPNPASWKTIEELIEHLTKQKDYEVNNMKYTNTSRIAEYIASQEHNRSIYLESKLSLYDKFYTKNNSSASTKTTKFMVSDFPTFTPVTKESQPVSLVDHESWENIVQVAPNMAELLNQSPQSIKSTLNEIYRKPLKRRKKAIHSIAIQNGRPHRLTTMGTSPTTKKKPYNLGDMQQFARLVELQDDDMYSRVALRYLKHYVGPVVYDICREAYPHRRDVYLFNSSRVVLSLNNFTLSSMSIILTRARTLLTNDTQCTDSQLECQVSGTRVCVDSLAACDGVPNCGSYNIYDEDRLMCALSGLQRNVCMAALTVLAVLLTIFYAIHYWVKRCVPKVADAFFIYTHGVENILYLETVMQSPREHDKLFYTSIPTDELGTGFDFEGQQIGLCRRLWTKCCCCFRRKQHTEGSEHEFNHDLDLKDFKRNYSYTRSEISRIGQKTTIDISVQTGNSLEMTQRIVKREEPKTQTSKTVDKELKKSKHPPIIIRDSIITLDEPFPEEELSALNFFRESRSTSSYEYLNQEKVLYSTQFTSSSDQSNSDSARVEIPVIQSEKFPKLKTELEKSEPAKQSRNLNRLSTPRRIRFKDRPTFIHSNTSLNKIESVEKEDHGSRKTSTSRPRQQRLSPIREDEETNKKDKVDMSKPRHFWEGTSKKLKNIKRKTK